MPTMTPDPVNTQNEAMRELNARELADRLDAAIRDVVVSCESALGGRRVELMSPAELRLWSAVHDLALIGHYPTMAIERIERVIG